MPILPSPILLLALPCMLQESLFTCERAEFAQVQKLNGVPCCQDHWVAATVLVSEITENKRWLMVTIDHAGPPAVFRVINESWVLSCDEMSLTMLMRSEDPTSPVITLQKLRFPALQDFWMFAAAIAYARVAAYDICCSRGAVSGEREELALNFSQVESGLSYPFRKFTVILGVKGSLFGVVCAHNITDGMVREVYHAPFSPLTPAKSLTLLIYSSPALHHTTSIAFNTLIARLPEILLNTGKHHRFLPFPSGTLVYSTSSCSTLHALASVGAPHDAGSLAFTVHVSSTQFETPDNRKPCLNVEHARPPNSSPVPHLAYTPPRLEPVLLVRMRLPRNLAEQKHHILVTCLTSKTNMSFVVEERNPRAVSSFE
ncbi:hypothetical protein C2E23DRAFT_862676 [Lenzites betulinus]|nr:hypothetical protein C2E23DRAFT_862676 [Lenzites betulinus]